MLNLKTIRTRLYTHLKDDPNGNGTYSTKEINSIIEGATKQFFRESRVVQFKTLVEEKEFLFGLHEIKYFENEKNQILKNIEFQVVGELLELISPKKAYAVWIYAGFEICKDKNSAYFGDITHSKSLNTFAMDAIIYYSLALIFEQENNFSLTEYYLSKAKEISFNLEKNFNNSYKARVHNV